MSYIIEDSLKKVDGRFNLVHEVVRLAQSAPSDIKDKPIIWALKTIAENPDSTTQHLDEN